MSGLLDRFERIARSVGAEQLAEPLAAPAPSETTERDEPHPFEARNIHPDLPAKVRELFDDGHWEQLVFEAFKFIEKEVKRLSGLRGKTGFALMMDAFNEDRAKIKLNALVTESKVDEQKGFKFIYTGVATGIRNPRGHEVDIGDTPDEALDYLGARVASPASARRHWAPLTALRSPITLGSSRHLASRVRRTLRNRRPAASYRRD